jgi:hypothetical protein
MTDLIVNMFLCGFGFSVLLFFTGYGLHLIDMFTRFR